MDSDGDDVGTTPMPSGMMQRDKRCDDDDIGDNADTDDDNDVSILKK